MADRAADSSSIGARCAYCRSPWTQMDSLKCPDCDTVTHQECWTENGGCPILGCVSAPKDEITSAPGHQGWASASTAPDRTPSLPALGQSGIGEAQNPLANQGGNSNQHFGDDYAAGVGQTPLQPIGDLSASPSDITGSRPDQPAPLDQPIPAESPMSESEELTPSEAPQVSRGDTQCWLRTDRDSAWLESTLAFRADDIVLCTDEADRSDLTIAKSDVTGLDQLGETHEGWATVELRSKDSNPLEVRLSEEALDRFLLFLQSGRRTTLFEQHES